MAWYDDPSLVNPDSLPQDDTTGLVPALPAAPVAVRPSPFAAINQQLEQDLQRMQQPQGLQNLPPMGPSYSPEEWAKLQANAPVPADAPRTYAPMTGLKVIGNELAPSNLWTQGKAAVARLAEDFDPFANNDWRDQWRAEAAAKDEENRKYAEEQAKAAAAPGTEAYLMHGVPVKEIGGLGSNLAFSAAGMAGTLGGRAAGATTGAAIGTAVGTPGLGTAIGGITGGLLGGGAMAWKQQQVMFLEQLHDHLDQQSRLEKNKPLDPEEWRKTFSNPEIQSAMNDSALWEAGPEAVGNMLFLKINKLGFARNLSDSAWKKALKATGAVVADAAQEQGTETVTQMGQTNAEVDSGQRPESERRSWTSGADWKKSSDEVFAQTLLISGIMGGAGGAISKTHQALIQNPRDAEKLVDFAADPNVREALPTEALGNLATLGQWLQSRKLVSNDQLPGVVSALQADWAARQSEDPSVTAQREEYLSKLYSAYPDDAPIKATLDELWKGKKKDQLPAWVRFLDEGDGDYGLRGELNKDGTPTGNINLQGLSQLKPVLDIAGQGVLGQRTRINQDQTNQANFEGGVDPTTGDVVDDQGQVWTRDPSTGTLTPPAVQPSPTSGLNAVPPAPTATPIVPSAPVITDPKEMGRRMVEEALARKQAEKKSELPPIERPDATVVIGGVPVKSQTDQTPVILDAMRDLANKSAPPSQTPSAPSTPLSEASPVLTPTPSGEPIQLQQGQSVILSPTNPNEPIARSATTPEQQERLNALLGNRPKGGSRGAVSELPPIQRPDPTVVVGGVPVKAVTDQANSILDAMHRLKSTLSAVADQKRQAAQTPEAPAQLPTPPTPAPLDASPAASSPELATSQDLSSNASVGDEAGSVAQTDAGVLKEQEAIGVGRDPKKLQSRLNAAKQVLKTDVRNQFKDAVFDYENKRLVSSDGKLALQWVLRDKPNEPASYENQQTSRGAVRLINLSETSPTPTLTESAHQPTTENQNDSRSQEGQGQAEALLSNDQQTPASQEAGANPPVNTPNTGASNATQDRKEQQGRQPEHQGTGGQLEEGRGDRQQPSENQATGNQASGSDQPGQSGTEVTPNVASPQENEAPPAKPDILGENVPETDNQGVGKGEVGPVKKAPTKKTSKSTEPDLSPANREERQQAKRAEFLADPKFRDAMEGYARTAGWDQVGGLPITNDGSISGRLPWIPKDPWFQKSVGARKGLSLDAIPRLIRQFGRGEAPTTKPATNLLDFLIDDYIEGQALEEEARWLSDQLTPDEQVLLDRLTAELENHPAFGRDRLEMLLEKLAKQYPDITPAQFNRALIKTYEITLNGLNPSASQPGTASATGQATPGSAGTADQGTSSETSSEPILSSYSQADLDAETARVKDEIERQKQADAAAEAKKKADQERDSSALIGSDNAADLAAPTEPTVFPKDGTPAEKLAYLKTVPENARNNEYRRAVSAALVERLNLALPEGWKAEFNSEKHQHTLTDPKGVVRRTFNAPTVGNGTLSSWLDTATKLAEAEKTIKPEPTKTPEVAVEPQTGDDAQVGKKQTETKATPPVASLKPEFGANNTLVSRDRAEELKKRLKAKLNGSQLNSGIDPEILAIGTELTVFYLEGGVRKFADLARTIAAELGVSIDQIKPFVRGWYNGARDTMEDAGLSIDGIDTPEQVREAIKTLTAEDHQDANSPAASTTPADDKTGVAGSKPEEVRATGETGNAPDVSDGSSGTDAGILRHGAGLLPGSDGSIHEGQSDQGRSPVSTGTVSGILEPNPSGLPELPERFYEDYRLPVGGLERTGSWTETAKRNVDILELATKITQENRPATKEEQELLVKYVGFGAGEIRNKLFPPATPEELDQYPNANQRIIPEITANHLSSSMSPAEKARWVDLATRLSNLLSPEDQKTLLRSTQYAHYTSESIIRSIWNAMAQFGFNGGTIMEPGMGIGSFAMAMPEGIARNSRYMGIEMDGPTAMVAKLLLPLQVVNHADFTKQAVPNDLFDAAIGNPPFAKTVILSDPKYAAAKFKLHDYFFAKTIDSVRPGGLLVFVTSRYTMDKQNVRARKYLAERADFMGAIRLPQTAFRDNAGTDVVTDVIFLRKKIPGQNTTGLDWTALAPLATKDGEVQVNEYFVAHPDMILGQPRLTGNTDDQGRRINGLHPGDLTVVSYDASAADLEAKFAQAITNLPSNIYGAAGQDANTLRGATAQRDFAPKTNREGALYQDQTGALLRVENGVGVPLNVLEPWLKDKQLPFVKDYIDLLAQVRAAKMSQWEDGNWQEELDKLNAAYDAFRNNHGPLHDYTVQRRVHSDLKTVWGDLTEDERTAVIQLAGLSISPTQAWDKKLKAETKRAIADAMSNRDALPTSIRDALGRVIPEEEALINDSRKYKNKTLLDLDSDSAIIHALEHINEKGEIVKSPFLKGRTIRQPQQRTVSSPQDALAVSLDQKGYLDLADVAAQMQTTEAEAIKNLGDLLYQTPTGQWQMADEYLSGDVVTKLAEAVLAAKQNPELERNIKALETVQPLPKGIGDISANLGAGWIDAHYVEDFAREVLNLPATITYAPATATWIVHEAGGTGSRNARGAAHDWGILNIKTPHEILAAALSGGRIIISNTVRNGNTTTTVRDEDNTVLANDLVKRMREAFKAWVWTDPTRVQDLTANYNEKHNRLAGRKFDGSHLTLPGLSLRYPSIHPHQLRAIWRIIQTGNTYAAHAVGSGKTLEMIISGMEQRRLGLIKRPIYVVPNHMLEQFSSEFMDAYPTANIMVADDENFTGDVRRRFVARAALNNPDAIILTHSSFKLIGMNEEAIAPIKNKILSDIQDALNDLGKDQETRVLRSRLEQQLEQAEQRFDKMLSAKRDTAITFDELGADFIFYDEAHAARKLDFTTNLQLKGIDPQGSFQALDLYIKTRWLESRNKGRSFVFASGTPVTNTMGELYSLMRFFDEEALRQAGVHTFDAWAAMFGEVALEYEPDAQGILQPVERFSKFNNLPALMSRVRSFMDILTSSQLRDVVKGVPRIEGNNQPQMVEVQKSEDLADYMRDVLGPRLEASRKWKPSKEQRGNPDPIMAINQTGLLASIDMRFTDPTLPNDPNSKLNKMIDEIIADHQDIADLEYVDRDGSPMGIKGGTQIVFYNVGFGSGVLERRGFDARAWVNKRLRDAGIPANEIAWFDDANDDAKKERIFQDMRSGKIKILFGSAKKMGTGVNVQNRLKVLHYLDPPWYPSDVEQPFGRILRQGNQNPTVRIKTYGTVGTYEASQWGILARKMRFIEQALSGDNALNSMEDISAASMYEQAAAIVAGDPRFKVLADLTNRIKQLEALRAAHQQGQGNLVGKKRSLESKIELSEGRIGRFKQAESILGELAKKALFEHGEVNGQRFTKRGEFGEELAKEVNKRLDEAFSMYHKPVQVATINNILPVMLKTEGEISGGGYVSAKVYIKVGKLEWEIFWGSSTNSSGHRMIPTEAGDKVGSALHKVGNTASVRENDESDLVNTREELKNTTAMIGQPFAEERVLADMIVERNRLLQELSQVAPQQPVPAEDRLIAMTEAEAIERHRDQAKQIALYNTSADYVNRLLAQIPGMQDQKAKDEWRQENLITEDTPTTPQPPTPAFNESAFAKTPNETYTRGVNDIRRSVGSNQSPTGLDKPGFIAALKQAFPHLSEAINKVLARGERGEKGGTVLIDSNDPNEIARIYAEKTGIPFAQALKELSSDSPNLIKDQQSRLQGWYSPRAGIIFAILPNLSTRSAPAVFLHETKHSQQRDDLTRRAVDLINQRTTLKGPQLRAFLDRVNARLAAAGLLNEDGTIKDENEAAPYIVEQAVLEGRQNGFNYADGRFLDWVDAKIGKPVGDLIRKLVNFIRATMLRRGFNININKLTVDDLVNFAQIGVERAADGDVRIVGQVSNTRTGEKNVRWNNILDQAIRIVFGENSASSPVLFAASVVNNDNEAVNYGRNGLSALASNSRNGVDLVQPGNYLPLIGREVGAVRVESFRTGIRRVTTPQQAAALLSPIGRQAQEFVMALVTDAKGKPLAVIRHSIGTISQSQVDQKVLIGSILNVPNAAQVWFAHNHPSADATQSKDDNKLSLDLDILMRGSGVTNKGMLVIAANQSASWVNPETMDEQFFDKAVPMGNRPVPVFDRQFVLFDDGQKISREREQEEFVKQFIDPGVVLLDGDGAALAWIPISSDEMNELRTGNTDSGAGRLLKIIERTNAEGALIKVNSLNSDEQAVRNLMKFFNAANVTNVPAYDNYGQSFSYKNVPDDQVIFKSYAGPNARAADQSLLQQETSPQFSIAPTESLPELEKISETLDEAGGWNTNRAEEKTIIDRLRDVADKSRSKWVKMLTRQQLVELISHIPGVGPLAQAFEKTARNLDAMKQELKQLVYPVAVKWRDGVVRSRDNGYLLSKIIHASTLHGVDPLGDPPLMVGGQNPQQRAELAEKTRWHTLVKQWMKELETKDPTLAEVYKESRANYEMMREKRYEALMARISRSGNSMVQALLDRAEQGSNETAPEPLVAQLIDLKTADAKQYQKVRGAIISVFPNVRPKRKSALPAGKSIAEARALLDAAGKPVFDAVIADLQQQTIEGATNGPFQKIRYNQLFGQADRRVKEAANPAIKGFGRRLADLFDQDPAAFKALREALMGYLNQPNALLTIEDAAIVKQPGKTKKAVKLTDLDHSEDFNKALQALSAIAQPLFKETLQSAQNRMADHASTVKAFYETTAVNGPYAPLSRFGDYQVYAEKDGQPLPIYATFENASEQLRAVKALQEEGWTVSVGYQIEDSIINTPPSGSFIGSLFGMIEDTVKSEQEQALLKDDVYQLYLHSLPDMSASKNFIHRKGIPGFSQDALRAYAQLMNQSANAIARLTYSDILQEQLQAMTKDVKRIGQDPTDENIAYVNQAAPVVSELNNSYNWLMNPSNATLANRLTGLGFFWYLTNFSTSLVNLTQTPLMTFPDLAAKFGGKEAFNVLTKTIVDYGNWKLRGKKGRKTVLDKINARFDGDMGLMLDHIEKSGAVSRTETVMLADMGEDVAEFQTSKPMVVASAIKNFFSWPFQKSEVANREIAAIAAYTLARNKGAGHQQAQDIAYNVVFRTQNDYSNANRAAFMRGDIARVLFLFRSFSQMMTWRWLRDVHQMFKAKGVDPETGIPLKTIARDRVKWMLVSSFMFSGTMGLPIYAATMGIASMIAALVSDPDDPWDVETEVNQGIQAAMMALTNHKGSADVLRRGFMSGPIGSLTGIDLSPRVSMDLWRLWFRKVPGDKEGEDLGLAYLQQAAGPVVGGLGIGAVKGMSDLGKALEQRDGTLASRGLETMIPAPLRNALKTLRYYSEGVTTRRGDKIVDDPTKLDLIRQFIGFTPAEIADQYERNAAVKEVERALQQRRKNLTNRYVYALEQQDQDGVDSALEAIANFGLKNPQIAISFNTLSQAYRQRQRAKMMSENGLYIPSKGMRARLEGEGY